MFFSDSSVPRYLQIADLLRKRIARGVWKNGEKVPSLEALMGEFGVARVTVRQAIDVLAREGLVLPQRGKGTFVTGTPPQRQWQREWQTVHASVDGLAQAFQDTQPRIVTIDESTSNAPLQPSDGTPAERYVYMRRVHSEKDEPYCVIEIYLDEAIFRTAPDRYRSEAVIPLLAKLPQGGITQVDQVVGGTHYYKNVTTVIASKQGVGAKITLTPRAESYAASLGAINGRGESYGDTFSFNHFRNSVDGNFTYGVVLGDVVAGTVFGNRFDVTPYYTVELGERESKPYASRRAFRSGSPSVPIIQSGGQVTYSYWENNMWFNKATGQAALVPSPANNETSWGTTRPADAARSLLVPIPRKPDAPEPRPFKTPPVSSEATEIVFDFTGDYDGIFWDKRGEYMIQPWVPVERFRPSDWAYVDVSAEPPLMKTRHVTGFVGGCTRIYMDLSEGQDRKSTLVLPFKALSKSLTTRLVGTVGCEVAVVNSTAKPGTHFRVTIPSGAEMYIDGEPVTTTTDYPYDTNHKLAIRGNFQQDSLVFGAQAANGNNVGSFDYGAFTFYNKSNYSGLAILTVCITGWSTDSGFYDHNGKLQYHYNISESKWEWVTYPTDSGLAR